jgi:hypothetical protein
MIRRKSPGPYGKLCRYRSYCYSLWVPSKPFISSILFAIIYHSGHHGANCTHSHPNDVNCCPVLNQTLHLNVRVLVIMDVSVSCLLF